MKKKVFSDQKPTPLHCVCLKLQAKAEESGRQQQLDAGEDLDVPRALAPLEAGLDAPQRPPVRATPGVKYLAKMKRRSSGGKSQTTADGHFVMPLEASTQNLDEDDGEDYLAPSGPSVVHRKCLYERPMEVTREMHMDDPASVTRLYFAAAPEDMDLRTSAKTPPSPTYSPASPTYLKLTADDEKLTAPPQMKAANAVTAFEDAAWKIPRYGAAPKVTDASARLDDADIEGARLFKSLKVMETEQSCKVEEELEEAIPVLADSVPDKSPMAPAHAIEQVKNVLQTSPQHREMEEENQQVWHIIKVGVVPLTLSTVLFCCTPGNICVLFNFACLQFAENHKQIWSQNSSVSK